MNGIEHSWTTAGRAVRKTGSLPEPVAHYSHRTTSSTECSCGPPDAQRHKSSWRERKERYLAHLRVAEGEGILVSACDKLANLQAILFDLTEIGESVWARFSGGKGGSLWYYTALVDAFGGRVPAAMGCRRLATHDSSADSVWPSDRWRSRRRSAVRSIGVWTRPTACFFLAALPSRARWSGTSSLPCAMKA